MKKWFLLLCLLLLIGGATLPTVAQDLAPGWNAITPGGDAVCARGTPYTFYARPGDPSKLLIYFQGGGACWNDETCAPNSGLFDEVVVGDEGNNYSQGIFDPTNGENPLADYSTVLVTYCTGDYHTGDQGVEYSTGLVEHRGAVNAEAAIDFAREAFGGADEVVVAGCSAGGIGALYHLPTIARRFGQADVVGFGDSAVGVIPPSWGGFGVWNADTSGSPDAVVRDLYRSAARNRPVGLYTTDNDNVQITYYTIMGAVNAWTLEMNARVEALNSSANFASYIAPGGEHCISETPRFYSETINGVRFRDWFASLVGGDVPADVP